MLRTCRCRRFFLVHADRFSRFMRIIPTTTGSTSGLTTRMMHRTIMRYGGILLGSYRRLRQGLSVSASGVSSFGKTFRRRWWNSSWRIFSLGLLRNSARMWHPILTVRSIRKNFLPTAMSWLSRYSPFWRRVYHAETKIKREFIMNIIIRKESWKNMIC